MITTIINIMMLRKILFLTPPPKNEEKKKKTTNKNDVKRKHETDIYMHKKGKVLFFHIWTVVLL